MTGKVSDAKEAIIAELLNDVYDVAKQLETILQKVEAIDRGLQARIEGATKDAAGKAFLAATLNFKMMIDEQETKLINSGVKAAEHISNKLNNGATQLLVRQKSMGCKAKVIYAFTALIAFLAAFAGSYVAIKLLHP